MELGTYPHARAVLAGVIVYMLVMLAFGWWSSRQVKTSEDFIVAGRRLPLFFTTATLFATWFCAGSLMGATAQAYLFGNQGVIFDPWGAALCLILAGLFFARLMRRGGYLTLVDFFDLRYGKKMGFLSAVVLVVAEIGWVGAQLVAFGTILQIFTGLPLHLGILISCAVLIAYTCLGGMWSVTLTDVVQMIILIAGVAVLLPAVVSHIGGWEYLFTHAANRAGLPPLAMIPTAGDGYLGYFGLTGWFYYLGAWLAIGLGSIPAQDLAQRLLSARNEKVAACSSYLAAVLYLTVGLIPVALGMTMFEINPGLTVAETEMILPWLAMHYLPPALTVLFVAAMVAALMSSSDSALLAAASIAGHNGLRYLKTKASPAFTLKVTRALVPVIALVSLLLALYAETIYMLVVVAWSVILVGLFVPYAAGYFWKKGNQSGAIAALSGGFISWLGFSWYYYCAETAAANTGIIEAGAVYTEWALWDAVYIGSVPAFIVSFVLMAAVSLLTQKRDRPRPLVDMDGNPIKPVRRGFK